MGLSQFSQNSFSTTYLTGVVAQDKAEIIPHKPKMTKKDGFNLKTLFPSYNETYLQYYDYMGDRIILSVFIIFFCIIGLVGNGYVIWLLGFCMKRSPFAVYLLNLAVADFGSLVFLLPLDICFNPPLLEDILVFPGVLSKLSISLFISIYNSCQLLLAAISMDRWASVRFPNWYQCHRSPVLSTTMCAFIWAASFGLTGVPFFLLLMDFISDVYGTVFALGLIIISLSCFLLAFISTWTLFTKVCLQSQRCQHRNLLKVILLVLFSFLLFNILTNTCFFITLAYSALWISIRGSINPLIYFTAGRQNGGDFLERMKVILQRVFKEERDTRIELQPHSQMML